MSSETIIEQLVNRSVRVNGVFIPRGAIAMEMARHSFNLIVRNDDDTYKVSLVGSATAIRFRDKYILLCTQHQLHGVDPQQVSVLTDDGKMLITSGGFRAPELLANTDATDLAAFDFTAPVHDYPELRSRFFNFSEIPPPLPNTDIVAVLLSGFASKEQRYELADFNHLGLSKRAVVCLPHEQSSDLAILTLRTLAPLTVDPDGMSGGAAFAIIQNEGTFSAYFAGLVLTGGSTRFRILKSGYVRAFLQSVLS